MTAIHDNSARGTKRARKEFYDHLIAYLVVNAFLVGLDLFTGTEKLWFHWVLIGWGIGLAAHAVRVFGFPGHRTSQPGDRPKSPPSQNSNPTGV